MIENERQLEATKKAISDLEGALLSLKQDILPNSPARFALMAEPAVAQLRQLRRLVDDYIGMTAAVSSEAELWLRLRGPSLEYDDVPISVVSEVLKTLKTGLETTAAFLGGERSRRGHSPGIKEATDLRIVAWEPGSVKVGLRLPERTAMEPPGTPEQVHIAVDRYMQAARWASSGSDPSRLEAEIPDPAFRRLLLAQISRLVPRSRSDLEAVELSRDAKDGTTVLLRPDAAKRVRAAMRRAAEDETGDGSAKAKGVLREIDLDQRTFIVRDPDAKAETKCTIARKPMIS